jgi:hypothetical protein
MVNYLYDLDAIERNHEAYAESGAVAASGAVTRALGRMRAGRPRPRPEGNIAGFASGPAAVKDLPENREPAESPP